MNLGSSGFPREWNIELDLWDHSTGMAQTSIGRNGHVLLLVREDRERSGLGGGGDLPTLPSF